jgi:hypothetical protein
MKVFFGSAGAPGFSKRRNRGKFLRHLCASGESAAASTIIELNSGLTRQKKALTAKAQSVLRDSGISDRSP